MSNPQSLLSGILLLSTLTASAQQLQVREQIVDLGRIIYKHPTTASFEITNTGNRPVTIDKVKTSCGCTTVSYSASTIGRGQKFVISATYDAKMMGHFDKFIGIYTDKDDEPLMLHLKGVVVRGFDGFNGNYDCQIGSLRTDKDNIEFDDVNRGETHAQEFRIFNSTDEEVEPVLMHLPSYLTASVTPQRIAPGHWGIARLTLDSRAVHDYGLTQTSIYLGAFPGDKVSEDKEIPISTILLPEHHELTKEQRLNAAIIQMFPRKLKLGAFENKKKKKGTVYLKNVGRSPLQISSLQLFTGGVKIDLDKRTIAPGEMAKMKVTVFRDELKKSRVKPRVLMITNDPDNPKIVLNIEVED